MAESAAAAAQARHAFVHASRRPSGSSRAASMLSFRQANFDDDDFQTCSSWTSNSSQMRSPKTHAGMSPDLTIDKQVEKDGEEAKQLMDLFCTSEGSSLRLDRDGLRQMLQHIDTSTNAAPTDAEVDFVLRIGRYQLEGPITTEVVLAMITGWTTYITWAFRHNPEMALNEHGGAMERDQLRTYFYCLEQGDGLVPMNLAESHLDWILEVAGRRPTEALRSSAEVVMASVAWATLCAQRRRRTGRRQSKACAIL
mmetsp:Transcript_118659/g.332283  ORF Transcript_118659/g.332283 Transcript_118659/m.332283 type:complete len:254 (-) Transcript_118659:67-828(-)